MRGVRGLFVVTGVVLGACQAPQPPDQEARRAMESFRRHTTWRPPADVELGPVPQVAQGVFATSVNLGEVKVIQGDTTNVSPVHGLAGDGWGLRMDDARMDLARITAQAIAEEGDHFDFVVVFPAFNDLLNPGLAYYAGIRNADEGIGVDAFDDARTWGSAGRLQGFINMNQPAAYAAHDGLPVSDPDSLAHAIAGHELGHRWLVHARFILEGFNEGRPAGLLLGRQAAHWSALVHTGPRDPGAEQYASVLEGVSWRDNGDGTFTVLDVATDSQFRASPRARYAPLDLYLMGFLAPDEVEPFFLVQNARYGGQAVAASAVLDRGISVTGTRMDLSVDHVMAALGRRVPDHVDAQKDFSMAVVVVTPPGTTAAEVTALVAEVDTFRVRWEARFQEWTRGRGTLCTSLSGVCQRVPLELANARITPSAVLPGESVTVTAEVHNLGASPSASAAVTVDAGPHAHVEPATALVGSLATSARAPLRFTVTALPDYPCGEPLLVTLRLSASGASVATTSVRADVGVTVHQRWDMEDGTGWTVDPDGTDTALAGAWSRGAPRPTSLAAWGYAHIRFQPAEDASADGTRAFLTDPGPPGLLPAEFDATDVDLGHTTLQSPVMNLAGMQRPVLAWSAWHAALLVDLVESRVDDARGDDLVMLVSVDDGAWTEVHREGGSPGAWVNRDVALWRVPGLSVAGGARLRVRWVVGDAGAQQNIVEAGVDDVSLAEASATCRADVGSSSSGPPSSGGISSGGASGGTASTSNTGRGGLPPGWDCGCATGSPVAGWLGVAVAAAVHRRRRRAHC
ncbi:MAG: hypothetical protein HY904_25170 [Deltaproteobacteria bacterium]|nr:hypothetical protein [Deltaproteobacteria bacterium]